MISSKCLSPMNFGGGGSFGVFNGSRGHNGSMDEYK